MKRRHGWSWYWSRGPLWLEAQVSPHRWALRLAVQYWHLAGREWQLSGELQLGPLGVAAAVEWGGRP